MLVMRLTHAYHPSCRCQQHALEMANAITMAMCRPRQIEMRWTACMHHPHSSNVVGKAPVLSTSHRSSLYADRVITTLRDHCHTTRKVWTAKFAYIES